MDKQYIKVKFRAIPHASSKKISSFCLVLGCPRFCKRVQNSRICQHCDVKTSTVIPTFYYLCIIFLTCCISVSSFIYKVLLLRNHLKPESVILCRNIAHIKLKNLSDLKFKFHFCDVIIDDVTKWAFWSCAVLTQKMDNLKK